MGGEVRAMRVDWPVGRWRRGGLLGRRASEKQGRGGPAAAHAALADARTASGALIPTPLVPSPAEKRVATRKCRAPCTLLLQGVAQRARRGSVPPPFPFNGARLPCARQAAHRSWVWIQCGALQSRHATRQKPGAAPLSLLAPSTVFLGHPSETIATFGLRTPFTAASAVSLTGLAVDASRGACDAAPRRELLTLRLEGPPCRRAALPCAAAGCCMAEPGAPNV